MVTAEITITREQLLSFTQPMQFIGIDWETYEAISEELGEASPVHLTYHDGILTIMPITKLHERLVRLLERLLGIVSLVTGAEIVPVGSATLRSKSRSLAVEPDLSFYLGQLPSVADAGVEDEIDRPPDLVVEVDINHSSNEKFGVYAEFGVPEFWHYDNEEIQIFILSANGEYESAERSSVLPVIESRALSQFLERGISEGRQAALLSDFQKWIESTR